MEPLKNAKDIYTKAYDYGTRDKMAYNRFGIVLLDHKYNIIGGGSIPCRQKLPPENPDFIIQAFDNLEFLMRFLDTTSEESNHAVVWRLIEYKLQLPISPWRLFIMKLDAYNDPWANEPTFEGREIKAEEVSSLPITTDAFLYADISDVITITGHTITTYPLLDIQFERLCIGMDIKKN